jgi:hypothetical protein
MKPTPFLPTLVVATGLLLSAGPAFAQMAEGLDTSDMTPAAPPAASAGKKPEPAPAATAEPREIGPSRYVTPEELPAYVRQLSARFSIAKSATDPFGRYQDPNFVAPEPKLPKAGPTNRYKPEPPMPFADVVAGITVNGVMPGKQQFLIGSRSFRTNDVFPLRLPNGKLVNVKVVSVSSARIRFRNVTTNETADRTVNLLPEGMTPGTTGKITAPGVEPVDSQAPVEIQPSIPLSDN